MARIAPNQPPPAIVPRWSDAALSADTEDLTTARSFEIERTEARRALQRERDLNAAIVETAGNMILVLNNQGHIVRFNRTCERVTGYTFEEVRGRPFWDIFLMPEEIMPVKAIFAQLHAGRLPERYENYWVTRGGEWRLIAWAHSVLLGENGEVEYVVGAGVDVSGHKKIEEDLRTSETRLGMQYGATMILAQCTTLNEAMAPLLQIICAQLGWDVGAFWSREPDSNMLLCQEVWYNGDDLAAFAASSRRARLAEGVGCPGRVLAGGDSIWSVDVSSEPECPRAEAAAEAELLGAAWYPVLTSNNPYGVLEFFSRDYQLPNPAVKRTLTTLCAQIGQFAERVGTQEALRRERDFSAAIVETAAGLVVVLDRRGHIIRFNGACERLTGRSFTEVRDAYFWDIFVVPRDVMPAPNASDGPPSALFPESFESYWAPPDGEWRLIAWSNVALRDDDGALEYTIGIGIDITERKRAEDLLRASETRLSLQYAATGALAACRSLDDAIPTLLGTICDHLGWDAGVYWEIARGHKTLRCREIWYRPSDGLAAFAETSRGMTFSPGIGLPGRVWASGKYCWIVDVLVDDNFPRAPAAAIAGLHGAVCVPVFIGGRICAVMELFSREIQPPNDDLGQAMSALGLQIGQFVERVRTEEAMRESDRSFRALIEKAPVGACITDERGRFEAVNAAYAAIFGYTPEELIGRRFTVIFPPGLRRKMAATYARNVARHADQQGEYTVVTKSGDPLTVLSTSVALDGSNGRSRKAVFAIDITERKLAEQRLAHLAHHDKLTGLANRALFHERLAQSLAEVHRHKQQLALLFLDLDGFKAVNDTLGHDIGDLLLQEVARRLTVCTRESDVVARLAGDEFTVILPNITGPDDAAMVAHRILDDFATGFTLNGMPARAGVSIGISLYPGDAPDAEGLIKSADAAMYHAKKGGKNAYHLAASRPARRTA